MKPYKSKVLFKVLIKFHITKGPGSLPVQYLYITQMDMVSAKPESAVQMATVIHRHQALGMTRASPLQPTQWRTPWITRQLCQD